jgi:hypothetical protein
MRRDDSSQRLLNSGRTHTWDSSHGGSLPIPRSRWNGAALE